MFAEIRNFTPFDTHFEQQLIFEHATPISLRPKIHLSPYGSNIESNMRDPSEAHSCADSERAPVKYIMMNSVDVQFKLNLWAGSYG